jgi:secreted trypsin-like serine protease
VSWGAWDCGLPDYPEVYTKVSAVRNWIIYISSAKIIPNVIIKADAIP